MDARPAPRRPQWPPVLRFARLTAGSLFPPPLRDDAQPEPDPVKASVCYLRVGEHVVSSIYREWPAGTTGPGGACRRCPTCTASDDACHMQVRRHVPREEAASFAVASLPHAVRQYL